jgi:hypothetical protein
MHSSDKERIVCGKLNILPNGRALKKLEIASNSPEHLPSISPPAPLPPPHQPLNNGQSNLSNRLNLLTDISEVNGSVGGFLFYEERFQLF